MRARVFGFAAVLALLAVSGAWAQSSPTTFVMGTYYRCVQGDATRADALYKEHVAPFLKAEQAAGRITAYGWAKHWEGGDSSR